MGGAVMVQRMAAKAIGKAKPRTRPQSREAKKKALTAPVRMF
ncbi:hypothetical protein CGCA056_v012110 [Colletotrichum aenigma]|nr:uncharacterized protein CGCA056_v012110 [Colletotrichum aenigma]KAF5512471.1 hypothetical protein CGCA056_v012110 [Colletotrichum aenigma]